MTSQNHPASFDKAAMQHLLEHDNHEPREALRELFKDELFIPRYAVPLAEERELALQRLKKRSRAALDIRLHRQN